MNNVKTNLNFEIFTATGTRGNRSFISIFPKGFRFSSKFCQENKISQYNYVKLVFSKNENRIIIGFYFTNNKSLRRDVFKIITIEKNKVISAKSFLDAYQIDTQKYTGQYIPSEYYDSEIGKLFVITLTMWSQPKTRI